MSIMLILMGLLLPALAHSRDVARSSQCQSHQYQIAVATTQFAGDWFDLVPREGISPWRESPGVGEHIPWINAVRPYLGRQSNGIDLRSPVFLDPAHPNPNHSVHYVVNGIAFVNDGGTGWSINSANRRGAVFSSWWHRPSNAIYLTAFTDDRDNSIAKRAGVWRLDVASGIYDVWNPLHLWGPDTDSDGSASNVMRVGVNRHGNRDNVLFADMHVDAIASSEVLKRSRWYDGIPLRQSKE